MDDKKKLIVGWFTFTCSEDSTILFTELINDHYNEWKNLIEFRHFKTIKSNNVLLNLDVAFVEGAISSEKQALEAQKVRDNSKYVIAIGACACTGMPSASRNTLLNDDLNERIKWYMETFDYSKKVKKLGDVIKVDDMVNGCPMHIPTFLEILNKYLKIFNIT